MSLEGGRKTRATKATVPTALIVCMVSLRWLDSTSYRVKCRKIIGKMWTAESSGARIPRGCKIFVGVQKTLASIYKVSGKHLTNVRQMTSANKIYLDKHGAIGRCDP